MEFCTIEDGQVSDLGLHAGILDDEDLNERLAAHDAERAKAKETADKGEPGPAQSEADEADVSDLDDIDDLLDDLDE